MPTPNTEMNSNVELNSLPINESNNNISSMLLMNTSETSIDTCNTLPVDFDSSNSSVDTEDCLKQPIKLETSLPMLTDIAEETVYETEFFEETFKQEKTSMNDYIEKKELMIQSDGHDISNILIDTTISESAEQISKDEVDRNSANVINTCRTYINDGSKNEINANDSVQQINTSVSNNEIFITSASAVASTSEISNLISISNNTNFASGLLENVSLSNNSVDNNSNMNIDTVSNNVKSHVYTNISNVIHVNSINNNQKISTLKSIAIQSTPKFVPISIAPANPIKRPANISVGQPATNVLTKVIVSQGKVGQPLVITNSSNQKSLCVLPNSSNSTSPVKSITAAQAKQMGIRLQSIRPTATKALKQKIVFSNISPGTQVLKKIQHVSKSSTPTKILPAPLVSKSTTAGQPTKIYVTQDYIMKAGTLIPKQPGGQVITISNLQSASVVPNHVSPKKQVQYIKLINNVGSTNVPTVTTTKGKISSVAQNPVVSKIDNDTPIIVASSNITAANLNIKGSNSMQPSKGVGTTGITVLPVLSPNMKTTPGQRLILPAVSKSKTEATGQTLLQEAKQLQTSGNIVVLPEDVLEKIKGELLSNPVKLKDDSKTIDFAKINHDNQENVPTVSEFKNAPKSPTKIVTSMPAESGNGLRSRKPCNCTRSQCLKLYCECFANGEFCNNCNCVSCHNNISHEENRQHAIRSCLDRNPQAFRPKIGKCLVGLSDRRHTKGCHCKRSGCLKNYCECYEAQIPCSENCKCVGCKNIDEMLFATSFSNNCANFEKPDSQLEFQTFTKNKLTAEINDAVGQSGSSNPRHAFSFIKDQVVEATCQCLLAQADEVKRRNINIEDGKKYILEEFGRCLIQIIECAPDKYVPS